MKGYKLVQIPHTGGVVNYPDDQSLFRETKFIQSLGMVVGWYKETGTETIADYTGAWPVVTQQYRTRMRSGEVLALLKDPANPTKGSYAKIHRAAYPKGSETGDNIALEFLEQAKNPYSADGMIDAVDLEPGLDYFISVSYIDADDKARVMKGWPI